MRDKLARGAHFTRFGLRRFALAIRWLLALAKAGWRWLEQLQIPLSPLQWVLALYLAFGAIYALATPVFEANEELWHFGFVEHLRREGALPVQDPWQRDTIYRQHGSQPPLYYALVALLTAPIDIEDAASLRQLNPHVNASQPAKFGNKNLVIHDATRSRFEGASLAVLLARAAGIALGAGTIALVYKIGELIAPQRQTVAFVAAAITGLNPMFIFVSASVNNDSLAMLLNGATVLLALRTLRDGFDWRRSLAISLCFAFTSLTKLTGLVFLPALLGAALFAYRKTQDRRGLLLQLYLLVMFWTVIALWWYLRNAELYGEPLGLLTMAEMAGARGPAFSLVDLFAEFQQFRMSYWGLFGALNIQVSSLFYILLDLMTLLSAIGCVFLILQLLAISDFAYARYELAQLLALIGAAFLLWIALLYWSSLTAAAGRVLFPMIAVLSPLLAVGFVEVVWWVVFSLRPPNLEFVRAGDAVPKALLRKSMIWQLRLLGLAAFFAPITAIAGHYAAPAPVDELPAGALPIYAEYGDLALIGYERIDRRYSAGDRVGLTLYWQVLERSASDASMRLTLLDDYRQEIGRYASFPGAGALRTSAWQAGAVYPDKLEIVISPAAYGRYPFDLRVEWRAPPEDRAIPARGVDGKVVEPVLLRLGAVATAGIQTADTGFSQIPLEAQPVFDEVIRLEAFQLDLELNEIILSWKADSTPDESYTVFAHLLDEEGQLRSQDDRMPRLPTKYWRWGETFTTAHRFAAERPMLDYRVSVGLYINDGLTYPRAEFKASPPEPEAEPGATPLGADMADSAEETAMPEEPLAEETLLDAYTIPWDIAQALLDMTATAEAEAGAEESATATDA